MKLITAFALLLGAPMNAIELKGNAAIGDMISRLSRITFLHSRTDHF